jgi:hypothetical protein
VAPNNLLLDERDHIRRSPMMSATSGGGSVGYNQYLLKDN